MSLHHLQSGEAKSEIRQSRIVKKHWQIQIPFATLFFFRWDISVIRSVIVLKSGLWSRYQNFRLRLRLQHLEIFGSSSRTIWSKNQKKTLYYLYNSLEAEPPSEKLLVPAPAIQNCLGSGFIPMIKDRRNSIHYSTFWDVLPELT